MDMDNTECPKENMTTMNIPTEPVSYAQDDEDDMVVVCNNNGRDCAGDDDDVCSLLSKVQGPKSLHHPM